MISSEMRWFSYNFILSSIKKILKHNFLLGVDKTSITYTFGFMKFHLRKKIGR